MRYPAKTSTREFCDTIQGPLNGGASNGGVSRSGLVLPCLSFFVLFGTFPIFWDFPDLVRDGLGIFPIGPFPLSRPIKSTNEEQSRKGPRHNPDRSRTKVGNPPVWKHPGLASLKLWLKVSRDMKSIATRPLRMLGAL